eukprot:365681-Chlamydomonas_euryale.AAC.12
MANVAVTLHSVRPSSQWAVDPGQGLRPPDFWLATGLDLLRGSAPVVFTALRSALSLSPHLAVPCRFHRTWPCPVVLSALGCAMSFSPHLALPCSFNRPPLSHAFCRYALFNHHVQVHATFV